MSSCCRNRVVPLLALSLLLLCCGNNVPAQQEGPDVSGPKKEPEPDDLVLTVGRSLVVETVRAMERISVGFGDIAEATAITPRELVLNGKAQGVTSLIVWEEGGTKRFFNITVNPSRFLADQHVQSVREEIARELPGQTVTLNFENDTVFLRGAVRNVTSADRAFAIASTLGRTVNLLYVDVPPPEPQILLKVRFASVDRSQTQQLGMNIVSTGAGNTIGSLTTGQFSAPSLSVVPNSPVTTTVADALNLFLIRPDLNLEATVRALETKGLLQILAEPNMLAENGKLASFLAGGEFPFPSVSSSTGGAPVVSIQFREFGVRLTFTPVITPRGTIHLQVNPEVSALDFTNGLSVSGFNVPALTTRKLNTQVELQQGESFVIGGLLDNRTTDTLEKIPFISDIPVLGKLFQSKSISKQNTELIVIVTPQLVRPAEAGQEIPALNFPTPFLPPNTGKDLTMPGSANVIPAQPLKPGATIPIEKLTRAPAYGTPAGAAPSPAASPGPAAGATSALPPAAPSVSPPTASPPQ